MAEPPEPQSGRFDGPVHRYALRVFYEDTDVSGVVYHANYLRWFERARSDMLRLLSIDQRAAADSGEGYFAVADMTIGFRAPARLDDVVVIETSVEEAGAATVRLRQRAMRGTTLLCDAEVRVGFLGPDLRPRRQPPAWRVAVAALVPVFAPDDKGLR
jgi:acyl-CoA thioester hydrolase